MKCNNINIVEYAKSYIDSHSKRNSFSDNKVIKHILEEVFESEFIIADNKKIIYSSSKFSNIIEKEISDELKDIINTTNGFRRGYLQLAPRKCFEGFVLGLDCSKNKYNKVFLIINCNLEKITQEVLPIINRLRDYVYLY